MQEPIGLSGVQTVPKSLQSVGFFAPRKMKGHSQLFASRAGLALQLHFCLKIRLPGGGLMRPSPDGPGDDARWLDAPLREPCGYAADFLNGPADKRRAGGIFRRRLGSARTLLARQRIVAIMAKASMTRETWRFHPCQERVSL